jgi:hypothetical protein
MSKSNAYNEKKARKIQRNALVKAARDIALNSQADYSRIWTGLKAWRIIAILEAVFISVYLLVLK